jgi:hypothetical protein
MLIFSKKTGGFYDTADKDLYDEAGTWPDDGVEVPQEVRDALQGKHVVADANGNPVEYSPSLTEHKVAKIQSLAGNYAAAIAQPVTYAGKVYQADAASVDNLSSMLAAFTPAGAAPTGFYWVAADNTQVPFTLADMQGLAAAMGAQGWAAFQRFQTRKAAVMAATSAEAVAAIVW